MMIDSENKMKCLQKVDVSVSSLVNQFTIHMHAVRSPFGNGIPIDSEVLHRLRIHPHGVLFVILSVYRHALIYGLSYRQQYAWLRYP